MSLQNTSQEPYDKRKREGWTTQEKAILYNAGFDYTAASQAEHTIQLQKQLKGRPLASIQTMLTKFRFKHKIFHNYGSAYPNFDQLQVLLDKLKVQHEIEQWKESEDEILKSILTLHSDALNYRFYKRHLKGLLPGRKLKAIKKRAQRFLIQNKNKIWSEQESGILISTLNKYGKNWGQVSKFFVDKSSQDCIKQYSLITEQQDKQLKQCIFDLDDKVRNIKESLKLSSKTFNLQDFAHIGNLTQQFTNSVKTYLQSTASLQSLVPSDIKEFLNKCICQQDLKTIELKLKKYII